MALFVSRVCTPIRLLTPLVQFGSVRPVALLVRLGLVALCLAPLMLARQARLDLVVLLVH